MATKVGDFGFSVVDKLGVRSSITMSVAFSDAVTLAQLDTAWSTMEGLLQLITGGSIQRGQVRFQQTVASPAAASADSVTSENAVFNFGITGTSHKQGIAIPAFLDTKLTTDGKPNLADTDVANFTSAVAAAITGGGTYATPDGVSLTAVVDAFRSYRKHRRQERALSFVQP